MVFRAVTWIEAAAKANLGGAVLQPRTGRLRNSIFKDVREDTRGIIEGVVGSEGVPYARIHELGGVTKPHRIEPKSGKALAFMSRGQQVFAKFVNHPGSKIPERSYLRSALAANEQKIMDEFGLFIKASFEGSKK